MVLISAHSKWLLQLYRLVLSFSLSHIYNGLVWVNCSTACDIVVWFGPFPQPKGLGLVIHSFSRGGYIIFPEWFGPYSIHLQGIGLVILIHSSAGSLPCGLVW